jgi:hypothetical protein
MMMLTIKRLAGITGQPFSFEARFGYIKYSGGIREKNVLAMYYAGLGRSAAVVRI